MADFCPQADGARTTRGRVVELGTNVPVVFEGRRVNPGDYVAADRSGFIVVPPEHIGAVLDKAERVTANEAAMAQALRAGMPPSQVMARNHEAMLESNGDRAE
jgi:4-hydroxy-4-methyl-2-oxoglutarate aldolase